MKRRLLFALDLVDDAALIAAYEAHHRPGAVPPPVLAEIAARGVIAMEIWRTGERLVMVCDVADGYPRPTPTSDATVAWEAAMDRFQRPLPQAEAGVKWTPMRRVFATDDEQQPS